MPASSPLVRDKRTWAGSTRPLDEHPAERAFALLWPERASIAIVLASSRHRREAMTQTSNRFFDEVARLMNDAAGVAGGVRREFDTLIKTQAERVLRELDVVQREDFEAVKEMARLAREENEALKARIAALEAKLAGGTGV